MTIFFDVDDTLYDRGMPFRLAVDDFFGRFHVDYKKAYKACTRRGDEVFLPSQRGEISMDEMYSYRWCKGFADVGIMITPMDALRFQNLYRQKQNCITISPVIETMLELCAKNADCLGIITNGPSEKQWNKIRCLNLERFIPKDKIIVSGDVGIDKPNPDIFRLAEMRSGKNPAELVYVGDSLANDILPASLCGWNTIWFNRNADENVPDFHINEVVTTEEDLAKTVVPYITKIH